MGRWSTSARSPKGICDTGRGFSSRAGITSTTAIGSWINETGRESAVTTTELGSTTAGGKTTCDTGKVSCLYRTSTNTTARGRRIAKKGKARQSI